MVSRRPNSKDTASDRNSNIAFHQFLKNFAGIIFRESPILKNFAGIDFCESTFWGSKKEFIFANLAEIREIFFSRKFLPL